MATCHLYFNIFIRMSMMRIYPILCGKNSRGWGFACGGGVGGISCWGFSSQGLPALCGDPSARFCPPPDGVSCSWGGWLVGPTGGLSDFGCMFPETTKSIHKLSCHWNTAAIFMWDCYSYTNGKFLVFITKSWKDFPRLFLTENTNH